MMSILPIRIAGIIALAISGLVVSVVPVRAETEVCVDCLRVRVGPPVVARGPFPDELDAPFTALNLADGSFRAFSANGVTYALESPTLWNLEGPRRAVMHGSKPGGVSDCGRWLTTAMRWGTRVLGLVHQERDCDYRQGRTHKSMAIATSDDEGLNWSTPETVITGRDTPLPDRITGEGDCTMVDGQDGFYYAYCLRNSDWQTIAARAPVNDVLNWHKYFNGAWAEPGLGGNATAIGYLGPGAAVFPSLGWVATITSDAWFSGLRLSLSTDKVNFEDLDEPLMPIDGSNWARPADTGLLAYVTMLNPEDGSTTINGDFMLSYIYVPPGKGFESRYLVQHQVALSMESEPQPIQAGMALTRWRDPARQVFVSSTAPMTGERRDFQRDETIAYILTRAPETAASIKYVECSREVAGNLDHILAVEGSCAEDGYQFERTAGWLLTAERPGSVPVYRCRAEATNTHFASSAPDCEGLGQSEFLYGYGLGQ